MVDWLSRLPLIRINGSKIFIEGYLAVLDQMEIHFGCVFVVVKIGVKKIIERIFNGSNKCRRLNQNDFSDNLYCVEFYP